MPGSFEGTKPVSVNGTTLAYREQGVGEPVVLVHGASDLRIWEHQEAAVAYAFRSIAYSRRYARPNADIDPGIDDQMPPHVEDLAALLNAIGAAPLHLIGALDVDIKNHASTALPIRLHLATQRPIVIAVDFRPLQERSRVALG